MWRDHKCDEWSQSRVIAMHFYEVDNYDIFCSHLYRKLSCLRNVWWSAFHPYIWRTNVPFLILPFFRQIELFKYLTYIRIICDIHLCKIAANQILPLHLHMLCAMSMDNVWNFSWIFTNNHLNYINFCIEFFFGM